MSEPFPISKCSRLQQGSQGAPLPAAPLGRSVVAQIFPTPSSVITLSASLKSLTERPWHGCGE